MAAITTMPGAVTVVTRHRFIIRRAAATGLIDQIARLIGLIGRLPCRRRQTGPVVLETTADPRHLADQHHPADPPVDRHRRHALYHARWAAAVDGDKPNSTEKPALAPVFLTVTA
jgi:hypothetical protein